MRRDSRFRKGIPSILLLFLISVSVLTPLGGLVRPAEATSSTTMQQYTFQTPGSFFNGKPGPNINVTYRFYPTGTVNWFNSMGGNGSLVIPSLSSSVVQSNSSAFWYSMSGTILGATVSATVYFVKLSNFGYPSPNMKIKIVGTSTGAVSLSFPLQNVNNAQVVQNPSDPCTVTFGGLVGFSWCDAPSVITFNAATSTVVVSLPAGPFSIDPVTVGTSTITSSTQYPSERKVFFAATRYWAFYGNGTYLVYSSSTDGSTWTVPTKLVTGAVKGYDVSTWVDNANAKIYYVRASDSVAATVFQRAGTLNTDGTISWDYAEGQINVSHTLTTTPSIAKDTASTPNLWVAFNSVKTNNPNQGNFVDAWKCPISSPTNCGTSTNWTNSLVDLINGDTTADGFGTILLPLTAGKLFLLHGTGAASAFTASVKIHNYDGTGWVSSTTTTNGFINAGFSAISISDTMYFAGKKSDGTVSFLTCAYTCTNPVGTPISSATTNTNVAISSDGSSTLLATYGQSGSSVSIFYKVSTNLGSSWGSEIQLVSESVGSYSQTLSYAQGNGNFQLLWTSSGACSCNVRFATLSLSNSYTASISETPTISDAPSKLFNGFRNDTELVSSTLADAMAKAAGKFLSEVPSISDVADRLFNGLRSLTESPTISDVAARVFTGARSISENFGVVLSDGVTRFFQGSGGISENLVPSLSDSISKSAGKFASEAPPLADAVSRLFTGFRSIPENLGSSLSDSISKMAGKFLSETPSLSDAVARLFTGFRGLSETPTLADVVARVFTGFGGLSESPTVSDALSKVFAGFRGMTETPTISDALSRVFTGFRTLAESPAIPDALSRVFTGFRALSETPTLSDAVSRVFTGFRSMSESLAGMTDSISKSAGKFLSEAPPLSDVANRLFTGFGALSETPTVSDVLSKVFSGVRALAESPTISDALNRVFTSFRGLSEAPTVADAVARVYNGARTLAESLTLSDIVSKGATVLIGLTEDMTSTLSDSASKLFTGFRETSDSIATTLSDSISKSAGKFLSEAPPLFDVASKLFTGLRGLTETPTVSDALSRVYTGFRTLSETPTTSDALDRVFTGFRSLSEAPTISDVVTRVLTGLGGLSESPTVSDAVSRLFTGFRGMTETPTISDALSRVFTGFRTLAESPTISDALSRVFTGFRALSETPTLSDAVSRVFTGFRSMSESLAGLTDSISKSAGKFLSEAPPLSDIVGRLFAGFRGLTEAPAISDMTARIFTGARTISEDFASVLSDSSTRIITGFRGASENLASSITDSILKVAGHFASISENPAASISDTVTRLAVLARISPEDLSSISDSVSRVFAGARTISENLASVLSDSATRITAGFRGLTESLAISDMTARVFTGARSLSENFGAVLSDSVIRFFQGSRGISESLVASLSDSISKSAGKFASEAPPLSDVVSRLFTGFRGLTETPAISDMTARVFTGARTISEDFASVLSDSATRIITGFRGASENLASSITDSMLKVAGHFASISENPAASISDTVTRLAVLARISPGDLSSISDSVSRVFSGSRGISESLASFIGDTVSKGTARFLSLTEDISATLSDAVSRSRAITLRFADASPFSESDSASRLMHSIRDVLDDFYYSTVMPTFASLAREQPRSGGSNSPLSFITDLANRLAPGFEGLTGSSTGANTTVVAFGTIGAVAAAMTLFFFRRRGSGCHVLTVAAPPCPRFGAEHKCVARGGHTGAHRCRCGASW